MLATAARRHVCDNPTLANPGLTLVVPCYNEAESLEKLRAGVDRLRNALSGRYTLALILVDDCSRDATWSLMRKLFRVDENVKFLRHKTNLGIAAAIRTGLQHATTEIVASLDADCTYDPLLVMRMLPHLESGADLVVASPYHREGRVVGVPAWRLALSRLASQMYGLVLRNKLHTYTSCVRVYRRSAVVALPATQGGFAGIAELVWRLDQRGGRIAECPATLQVRTTGQSKMRVARTAIAHLQLLARAAWERWCEPWVSPRRSAPAAG